MRTKNRPIEVLAPAGSMECLKAAILNGADAVYLGGEMFGARAYAGNFNKEELLEAIDYVHLYGKKLFLTVNTLMKEEELPLLPGFLKPFYEQGLDAVIVQDLGAVSVEQGSQRKVGQNESFQQGNYLWRRFRRLRMIQDLTWNVLFMEHYATAIQDSVL